MFHSLIASVLILLGAFLSPPAAVRIEQDPNPIVSTSGVDGLVVSVHVDGSLSATDLLLEEGLLLSSSAPAKQGPMPLGTDPVLQTAWCDAQGVSHTVTTPIPSTTDAGLARAVALHERLVALLKAKYPPRPCPVPP